MRILLACECSNEIAKRFRQKGHFVMSCDFKPNEESQEFHYQGNVLDIIDDGFDLMIAHPPCTHLATSGAKHFWIKKYDGRQADAIEFFMKLVKADINKKCIENPVGIMSEVYRKPNQIVQPYYFGDNAQKTTCLWLFNLPKLFHAASPDLFNQNVTHVDKGEMRVFSSGRKMAAWTNDAKVYSKEKTSTERSRTFPGIAAAMVEQWS